MPIRANHRKFRGQLQTKYDTSKPQIWKLPLFLEIKPSVTVKVPRSGYLVPAGIAAWVGDKLKLHGIAFEVVKETKSNIEVEAFRASEVTLAKTSFEGRTVTSFKGKWGKEKRTVPKGSLFIPVAQPNSLLLLQLLEPQAPDSLATWGFFNAFFERKEYMEAYVTEAVAREMLKDPKIKADFAKKIDEDDAFAKSPEQRLEYFYRRHPSWDDRYNLYPILRTDHRP